MKNGQLETNDLFQIIGQKEAELYILRLQLQQAQQRIQELTDKKVEEDGE